LVDAELLQTEPSEFRDNDKAREPGANAAE